MTLMKSVNKLSINPSSLLGGAINGDSGYDKSKSKTGKITGIVSSATNLLGSLKSLAGIADKTMVIGEIPEDFDDNGLTRTLPGVGSLAKAVSSQVLGNVIQKGVTIDGYIDITSEMSVTLLSQPMMYDETITTHRVRDPNTVVMRVVICDIIENNLVDKILGAADSLTGGLVSSLFGDGGTKSSTALKNLLYIQEHGEKFTLYTPLREYERMVIKNIKVKIDKTNMESLYADITFQEVIEYEYWNGSYFSVRTSTPAQAGVSQYAQKFNNMFGL